MEGVSIEQLQALLDQYIGFEYVLRGFAVGFVCVAFPAFWGWVRRTLSDVDE